MIRYSFVILGVLLLGIPAVAQNAPKPDDNKPDQLKKKSPQVEKKKPDEPEKLVPDEKKKPKTDMPAAGNEEEDKILERLTNNSKNAEERLAKPDTGAETRKLQGDVLKDIDELIKKLKQPPPPQQQQNQNQSGGGGGGGSQSPMGGGGGGGARSRGGSGGGGGRSSSRQRRQQRQRQRQQSRGGSASGSPMGQGQPMAGTQGTGNPMNNSQAQNNGNQPMGGGKPGQAGNNAGGGGRDPNKVVQGSNEMYKDVWGHLPEKMRQEMDSYFKERFMPRYSDLLKQYYSTIAERNKKK